MQKNHKSEKLVKKKSQTNHKCDKLIKKYQKKTDELMKKRNKVWQITTMDIMLWEFFMFYQVFLALQVKRDMVKYELQVMSYELKA